MARPKREVVMARCAGEALLAAVEIYNKPRVEYREQTVAFLLVNAWEVIIKARIVNSRVGVESRRFTGANAIRAGIYTVKTAISGPYKYGAHLIGAVSLRK